MGRGAGWDMVWVLQVAAVMMEVCRSNDPPEGHLERVRQLCDLHSVSATANQQCTQCMLIVFASRTELSRRQVARHHRRSVYTN